MKLTFESIAFQNRMFGKELELFFQNIKDTCKTKEEFVNYHNLPLFSSIVAKHTGLNIDLNLHQQLPYGTCVMLPPLHNNHIFVDNQIKPFLRINASPEYIDILVAEKSKNSINTKEGMVYGFFTKIRCVIHVDFVTITDRRLTIGELVAPILHEIGHVFNYFEYFDRTVTTNQILANVSETFLNIDSYGLRKDLVQKAANALNVNIKEVPELSDNETSKMTIVALLRKGAMTSATASTSYDRTSEEALADQFVARHGYARELASNMYKSGELNSSRLALIRWVKYIKESWRALPIVVPGLSLLIFNPLTMLAVFTFIVFMRTSDKTTNSRDFTYDQDKIRLKRIREQLIILLKDQNLDKETVSDTLDSIKCIDEISKYIIDKDEMINAIADFIRPFNNSPAAVVKLNRQLEELASNDLFVSAAKLNELANSQQLKTS